MNNVILMVTLFFCVVFGQAVNAAPLNWHTFVDLRNGDLSCFSLNSTIDGDYFASYFNSDVDYVQTSLRSGGSNLHQGVSYMPGAPYSYSDIDNLGNTPVIVFNDEPQNSICLKYYLNDNWSSSTVEIPNTGHVRILKCVVDGDKVYVLFSQKVNSISEWHLKLAVYTAGAWHNEHVVTFDEDTTHWCFDLQLDTSRRPCIAYWDRTDSALMFSRRVGMSNFDTDIVDDQLPGCSWLKLGFLQTDIPVIGYVTSQARASEVVKVAHTLGANWGIETIYSADNIHAIDMALNSNAGYITSDFYFVLEDQDGYQCIYRVFPGWESEAISELIGQPHAYNIVARWNHPLNEVGVVLYFGEERRSALLAGRPESSTPTATPVPSSTPTPPPSPTWQVPTQTPGPDTPTAVPTYTPTACPELGATIDMPKTTFHAGDTFYCNVNLCNPTSEYYMELAVFLVLDVYGNYFFAPDFSHYDFYTTRLKYGTRTIEAIPAFTWPSTDHGYTNIWFYAGMTDIDVTGLIGTYDAIMFEWN